MTMPTINIPVYRCFAGTPAELKAFRDGWAQLTLSDRAFSVVMEDDFSETYYAAMAF